MKWERAPHSKDGKYKLVSTEKSTDNIYITIIELGKDSFTCKLTDVHLLSEELQDYVSDLLPKIVSGVYDVKLIDERLEELGE